MSSSTHLAQCGLLLGTHYEIIEKCLVNLDVRQLTAVARVCKAWNKVAKKLVNKRQRPLAVVSTVQVTEKFEDSLEEALKKSFEHTLGHQSSLCFLMAPNTSSEQDFSKLGKFMSPRCRGLVIPADGVIGTNTDGSVETFTARAMETKSFAGISGIMLPEAPGVKIYTFAEAPQTFREEGDTWNDVTDQNGETGRFIDLVQSDETIKCVVFCTFMDADAARCIFDFITNRQEEPFAFGGYMANNGVSFSTIDSKDCKRTESLGCGFFITGENVVASSVVIQTQRENDIKQCFEKLKMCNFPEKNTVCLLFGCVGRSRIKKEVETFRKTFPNIPLAGCTGYGEFGINHLPGLNKKCQEFASKRARLEHNITYGYSSIYVMIHCKI